MKPSTAAVLPTDLRAIRSLLHRLVSLSLEKGQGLALWREARQTEAKLVWTDQPRQLVPPLALEELEPGFLLSPFVNPDLKETHFLPGDAFLSFSPSEMQVANDQLQALPTRLIEQLLESADQQSTFPSRPDLTPTAQPTFLSAAHAALEALENRQLEKVVLSRREARALPTDFDLSAAFDRLCARFPQANCSLVIHPTLGVWLGASPETLLALEPTGRFRTVALAGTQSAEGLTVADAVWRQKEIEEQALVCRYIIGAFKKIRLREYIERGPRTVLAGRLFHLQTDYEVDTRAVEFPELASVMLPLLHPTSATGGMPRTAALDFIARHEGHDRGLYAGFMGPVNIEGGIHLWVNLRCLQVTAEGAWLYAGAGLTASSNPEREWRETEMKLGPMLAVLGDNCGD